MWSRRKSRVWAGQTVVPVVFMHVYKIDLTRGKKQRMRSKLLFFFSLELNFPFQQHCTPCAMHSSCPCKAAGWWSPWRSFYADPSYLRTPPWQELAACLSVVNGFLIESPQVLYLLAEVNLEWCEHGANLHHPPSPFCHLTVWRVGILSPYSRQYFNPSAAYWASCCVITLIWSF